MTEEVVATYREAMALKNVEEDLRSLGIPSETIHIDEENRRIRVVVPEASKAEILEVLNRHEPREVR